MILLGGKWTADMAKDLSRGLSECLEMLLHIREQQLERVAMMIMGHDPSRDAARAIQCGWRQDRRQAYRPGADALSVR